MPGSILGSVRRFIKRWSAVAAIKRSNARRLESRQSPQCECGLPKEPGHSERGDCWALQALAP